MHKFLERWSLDAVIVAVVWGYVLGAQDSGVLLVLALSTWLTYVADRLRDVGKGGPKTDRHLYYKNNYRTFQLLWLVLFVVDVAIAWRTLPHWEIIFGLILVLVIVAYLLLVRLIGKSSVRIAFKRLAVPLIFTSGVGLMTGSWATPEGQNGLLVLLIGAFTNLVLISLWEDREQKTPWLIPVFAGSLLGLTLTGLPGCAGAFGFALAGYIALRKQTLPMRTLADGVLVLMALVILMGSG